MVRIAAGLFVLFAVTLSGCGDDDGDNDARSAAATEVVLEAENTTFNPEELGITAGEEIELTLANKDDIEHDFQIDEVDAEIVSGGTQDDDHGSSDEHDGATTLAVHTEGQESETVTFVINKPGSYEFYCTVSGHREAGMIGTLVVE